MAQGVVDELPVKNALPKIRRSIPNGFAGSSRTGSSKATVSRPPRPIVTISPAPKAGWKGVTVLGSTSGIPLIRVGAPSAVVGSMKGAPAFPGTYSTTSTAYWASVVAEPNRQVTSAIRAHAGSDVRGPMSSAAPVDVPELCWVSLRMAGMEPINSRRALDVSEWPFRPRTSGDETGRPLIVRGPEREGHEPPVVAECSGFGSRTRTFPWIGSTVAAARPPDSVLDPCFKDESEIGRPLRRRVRGGFSPPSVPTPETRGEDRSGWSGPSISSHHDQ